MNEEYLKDLHSFSTQILKDNLLHMEVSNRLMDKCIINIFLILQCKDLHKISSKEEIHLHLIKCTKCLFMAKYQIKVFITFLLVKGSLLMVLNLLIIIKVKIMATQIVFLLQWLLPECLKINNYFIINHLTQIKDQFKG